MRKRGAFIAAALVVASFGSARADHPAPIPPAAAGAVSSNVEYVASFPDIAAIGSKILGDTLYATTSAGLRIYDIGLTGLPILQGALNLPHWENEDVDTNGKLLFIAADHFVGVRNTVYVIDVQIRNAPILLAQIEVPMAHTATCVLNCQYLWLGGGSSIGVVDVRNPMSPRYLGSTSSYAGNVHDVQVDAKGVAWVSGSGGLAALKPILTKPLNPSYVTSSNDFDNDFIIHNSLRPSASQWKTATQWTTAPTDAEMTYVTEEDYLAVDSNLGGNGRCKYDGSFQTSSYRQVGSEVRLRLHDTWNLGQGTSGTVGESRNGDVVFCSSHYFDVKNKVGAVAWYEQGVRFLSVSNYKDIRQVGYWRPHVGSPWATKYVGEFVYVFDFIRGLDIIRFTGSAGSSTVKTALNLDVLTKPDAQWGWACRIPAVNA